MLILRSEDIAVNFNGTKNVDPAIIMTELQNIESLDKIMSLLKVSYILDQGGFKTEAFSGIRLREISRLLLTQEGFCFQLSDLIKENVVPINLKFYFTKSELIHGIKVQAEHTRGRHKKFNFYPFPIKGDKIQIIFGGTRIQKKFTMNVNKGKLFILYYTINYCNCNDYNMTRYNMINVRLV